MFYWLAAFSLACALLGLASPFGMDRLGMYAIPFQIAVLSRVSDAAPSPMGSAAISTIVAIPFLALFLGWLSLGATTPCMVPYQSFVTQPRLLLRENAATSYKYNDVTDPWDTIRPFVDEGRIEEVNDRSRANSHSEESWHRLEAPAELR